MSNGWKTSVSRGKPSIRCVRVLEPDLSPMENTVRDALDVQKQVALMIYWLATPTEYRTFGNLFGVAKSTALS